MGVHEGYEDHEDHEGYEDHEAKAESHESDEVDEVEGYESNEAFYKGKRRPPSFVLCLPALLEGRAGCLFPLRNVQRDFAEPQG